MLCTLSCTFLPTLDQLQLQQRQQAQQQQCPQQCDFHETALIDDPVFDGHVELIFLLQSDIIFESSVVVKANGDLLDVTVPAVARRKVHTRLEQSRGRDTFPLPFLLTATVTRPIKRVGGIDGAFQMGSLGITTV